jgi:hypothetical protein
MAVLTEQRIRRPTFVTSQVTDRLTSQVTIKLESLGAKRGARVS